ncbi:NAD-binding protein [Loktanella sp. SALINAS62]|uniref:potassium channel family protein n=1 Tax=Loktanella sp. SALINAS62 TaxID=2706124 RepID=UPI001B8D5940|nr:NAD-binding protein [Loktanella sp. SALINAS62]MBS1303391.1 TrkA family potassium uptake protein [Loktanella sp. SALINAS62]
MRIIVVGASRFGVATLKQVMDKGHEAVLVDQSRERLDDISDEVECGLVHGDGTLPSILREAIGDGADVLMMLTNHDEANILGAAVGRSIGVERIVVQIIRPELLPICEELGLDEVVMPHETVARSIVSSLETGDNTRERTETDVENANSTD